MHPVPLIPLMYPQVSKIIIKPFLNRVINVMKDDRRLKWTPPNEEDKGRFAENSVPVVLNIEDRKL